VVGYVVEDFAVVAWFVVVEVEGIAIARVDRNATTDKRGKELFCGAIYHRISEGISFILSINF
jgi:hypothetical protein